MSNASGRTEKILHRRVVCKEKKRAEPIVHVIMEHCQKN